MRSTDDLVYRLILDDPGDGRWNMAVDHALLDGIGLPGAHPVVRLYGFAPPTLSLGRFQGASEILDLEASCRDGLTVVRRPTGGQAVLHDGELTYSVVLGRSHVHPFSKREVYRTVARALVGGLAHAGLDVVLAGQRRGDLHNPDCFRTTGEYEVTAADGRKLVGSAQIVTRAGALQHGAIPLDESNRRIARYLRSTDRPDGHDSTSVSQLLARDVGFPWFREKLAAGLCAVLPIRPDGLSPAERSQAERRLEELYGTVQWNLAP